MEDFVCEIKISFRLRFEIEDQKTKNIMIKNTISFYSKAYVCKKGFVLSAEKHLRISAYSFLE